MNLLSYVLIHLFIYLCSYLCVHLFTVAFQLPEVQKPVFCEKKVSVKTGKTY